jgi:enoyl-CoA hydratase/carnithine racemase
MRMSNETEALAITTKRLDFIAIVRFNRPAERNLLSIARHTRSRSRLRPYAWPRRMRFLLIQALASESSPAGEELRDFPASLEEHAHWEFFITARRLTSQEALEIGLISRISDPVLDATVTLARNTRKGVANFSGHPSLLIGNLSS